VRKLRRVDSNHRQIRVRIVADHLRGIFASVRSLPRTVAFAGAWYFVVGFTVLLLASQSHALSPWTMGLPFVAGQLLMAALLHFASGETDVED